MKKKICSLLILLFLSAGYLMSQDYLISFAGSGAAATVATVKVENLTQNTNKLLDGCDVLHLMAVVTGIQDIAQGNNNSLRIYPNPMTDYARVQFILPEAGETGVSVYDLSGREICRSKNLLDMGSHTYLLKNIKEGNYFVRITSGRFSYNGNIISSGSGKGSAKIEYEKTSGLPYRNFDSKGAITEVAMQYTAGDRLKITGISGNYSTVVTDVPSASKTISFNFVACADGDGNNYPVVGIGTAKGNSGDDELSGDKGVQIWMAQNLKTTKLNDGTPIQEVNNDADWGTLTTPAFGWYMNNAASYKDVYGGYYNWYTVSTGKLCPTGWRVPNNTDWNALFSSLGGASVAGGKMKATGLTYWASPNTGATNESGFTGLAGGSRYPSNGAYSGFKYLASWWTATQTDPNYGFLKELQFDLISVNQVGMVKNYGRNVRCIKE